MLYYCKICTHSASQIPKAKLNYSPKSYFKRKDLDSSNLKGHGHSNLAAMVRMREQQATIVGEWAMSKEIHKILPKRNDFVSIFAQQTSDESTMRLGREACQQMMR
ncbi:unnamed protein product [Orchesella dallaii]|uniref:Uncharacterized protein n=1 Tax=Orchesella dallaii TaxID=48710 RepID=A0ABP1R660_9HEXA